VSTVTRLPRLPNASGYKDGPHMGRQAFWEIPYKLRNATLLQEQEDGSWKPGALLDEHQFLFDWVMDDSKWLNRRGEPIDLFIVGENAEEFAAALVLDLARNSGTWKDTMVAWSDSGQIIRAQRDNRADREILEWLEEAKILVFSLPEIDDRQYNSALNKLLVTRSKKASQISVIWATPDLYERGVRKFGEPYRV
jgi:hypothetical protein